MTVHIVSDNKYFVSHSEEILKAHYIEITDDLEEVDILILDIGARHIIGQGKRLTVVVSAWDLVKRNLPEDTLFFLKPVDVEYMIWLVIDRKSVV